MLPIVANSVAIARTEQAHEEGREPWVTTVGSIRRSKHGVPYSIARRQANA
jgi:hypothetical protein